MVTALLLVDVQHDFLGRPDLSPDPDELIPKLAALIRCWRSLGFPVYHIQTRIHPDGSDRMPHWAQAGIWACVEGTPGVEPPEELAPLPGEQVFAKSRFSGFANPNLEANLQAHGAKRLVIAGLYLHGCVRSTAMDAYERGYEVWVAADAVGSTEPVHAEATRQWMNGRVAEFLDSDKLTARLAPVVVNPDAVLAGLEPGACFGRRWLAVDAARRHSHKNPCDRSEILSVVPCCGREEVDQAVALSHEAQRSWSLEPERAGLLRRWSAVLEKNTQALLETMATEIGKPMNEANDEIQRALAHIETSIRLSCPEQAVDDGVLVRFRPVGCIGLFTPWNNPLAIPAGKLAPALAFGNSVVWKPSPRAPRTARLLMDALIEAGLPEGLVNLVHGDGETARLVMDNPLIAAVSVTGSIATGKTSAALCALLGKPIQAELGGNNAAIVLLDADLASCVDELALAAFSFSGQRCTAIRRFIVTRKRVAEFEQRFAQAAKALPIGLPCDPATRIGPLISPEHLASVESVVARALAAGARLVCGGFRPVGFEQGNWYSPTVLTDVAPDAAVVRKETFGPVALILPADDLEHAIALANAVPQGLLGRLVTENPDDRFRFAGLIEAGIIKLSPGPLVLHPEAPFGGWKASGIGPPEHGIWDREFFTRPQAIYVERVQPTP